jgi:hypothetical protein
MVKATSKPKCKTSANKVKISKKVRVQKIKGPTKKGASNQKHPASISDGSGSNDGKNPKSETKSKTESKEHCARPQKRGRYEIDDEAEIVEELVNEEDDEISLEPVSSGQDQICDKTYLDSGPIPG